jgi:ABC-type arginine/histidine transport system permease subunit
VGPLASPLVESSTSLHSMAYQCHVFVSPLHHARYHKNMLVSSLSSTSHGCVRSCTQFYVSARQCLNSFLLQKLS